MNVPFAVMMIDDFEGIDDDAGDDAANNNWGF